MLWISLGVNVALALVVLHYRSLFVMFHRQAERLQDKLAEPRRHFFLLKGGRDESATGSKLS